MIVRAVRATRRPRNGRHRPAPHAPSIPSSSQVRPVASGDSPKIDYKDVRLLQRYISERGKIVPSRITAVRRRTSAPSPRRSSAPASWAPALRPEIRTAGRFSQAPHQRSGGGTFRPVAFPVSPRSAPVESMGFQEPSWGDRSPNCRRQDSETSPCNYSPPHRTGRGVAAALLFAGLFTSRGRLVLALAAPIPPFSSQASAGAAAPASSQPRLRRSRSRRSWARSCPASRCFSARLCRQPRWGYGGPRAPPRRRQGARLVSASAPALRHSRHRRGDLRHPGLLLNLMLPAWRPPSRRRCRRSRTARSAIRSSCGPSSASSCRRSRSCNP